MKIADKRELLPIITEGAKNKLPESPKKEAHTKGEIFRMMFEREVRKIDNR